MNSPAMQMEGLTRGLKSLSDSDISADVLVTDQHAGITKMMREDCKEIGHYFDTWHIVKGIREKLVAITKERPLQDQEHLNTTPLTMDRVNSICNRLYHMASHTKVDDNYSKVMEEKRAAIISHLVGVCSFSQNKSYKKCGHGELKERLDAESSAFKKVSRVLSMPQKVKAIAKLSPFGQTSRLESYHRMILMFAPKHLSFGYQGMVARMLLAALRYNENCHRPNLLNDSEREKLRVEYVKYMGGKGKAIKVKEAGTNEYLAQLMARTEEVFAGANVSLPQLPKTPPTMTPKMNLESKEGVVKRYRTRFHLAQETASSQSPPTCLPMSTSAQFKQAPTLVATSDSSTTHHSTFTTAASTTHALDATPSTSSVIATRKRKLSL